MKHEPSTSPPYLRSLDALKEGVLQNGYTEKFVCGNAGYMSTSDSRVYDLTQAKVIAMFRFQGNENEDDLAELYIIEMTDGTKGTYVKRHNTAS